LLNTLDTMLSILKYYYLIVMKIIKIKKYGLTLIEIAIVVFIIFIIIAIVMPEYKKIGPGSNQIFPICIANMGTIHNATRMFYMENPKGSDFSGVTVDSLLKDHYLKTIPVCPKGEGLSKEDVFYKIIDKPGQKIDIVCINKINPNDSHGSFLTKPNLNLLTKEAELKK